MKTSNMLFNKLAMVILIIAFSVQNETSYAQYEEEVETTNGQNQQSESVDHSSSQSTAPSVQSETSIRPEDAPATSQIILPREDLRDAHLHSPFYLGKNTDHGFGQLVGTKAWVSSEWSQGVSREVVLSGMQATGQRYVDAGLIALPGGGNTFTRDHLMYALANLKMYRPVGTFGNTMWDVKTQKSIPFFEQLDGTTTVGGFSFPGSKYNFALIKMGTGINEGKVKNPCMNPGEMITPNPEYAPPITKVETVIETEIYERVDTAFVHTTDTLIQTIETERVEFVEVPTYVPSQGGGMMMSGGIGMGMSAGFIGPPSSVFIDNSVNIVDNSFVDNSVGDTYIEGDTHICPDPEPNPTGFPAYPENIPDPGDVVQPPTDGNDPEPVGHNPWTDGIPVTDPTDGTGGGPSLGSGKGVKGNNSSPSVVLEGTFFSPGALANAGTSNSIPKPIAPKENNIPAKGDIPSVQSDPRPMNPKGSIPSAPIKGNTPKSENTLAFNGPSKGNTPSSTYSDPRPMNPTTAPVKDNVPKSNIIPPSKPVTPKTHTPIQVKDNTPKSNISNPDPRPMNPTTASNQGTPSKPNTGGWGYSDFSGGTKGPSRGNTSGVTPKGNNNQSTPRPSSISTPKDNPATTTDNARVAGGTKSVKQSVRPDRGNNPQVKTPMKKNSPQVKSKPRQQPKVAKSAPRSKPQARPQGGSQSRSRQR